MADSVDDAPPGVELLIQLAWKSLKLAFETMPSLFVVTAFVAALIGLAEKQLPHILLITGIHSRASAVVLFALGLLVLVTLKAGVLAVVAIAVHRQILLTETASSVASLIAKRTWRFVCWVLGFELVTGALALPTLIGGRLFWLMFVAVVIAAAVFSVRSALVFPSVAIDVPVEDWKVRLKASWDQTRGISWTFFWALVGAILPIVLSLLLLGLLVSVVTIFGFGILGPLSPIMKILSGAADPFITALGAAVASWTYLWVTDRSRVEATV